MQTEQNARTRAEANLERALSDTATEIGRTDNKASLLLALDGVLVAAVATLGTDLPAVALAAAGIGVTALIASVTLGLLVVRPRFNAPRVADDSSNFVYWAAADEASITTAMVEDHRMARVRVLSTITLRKMRFLRWAVDFTLLAVVALAAAALIAAA
ncbi:Pycsar system effector family protein [Streptomyces violaceusniger]|uniref:Pycsar system effector family protein n=1 Tax=Streptomyces violaceusniger TaxID=68280 RepID=UPI0038109821